MLVIKIDYLIIYIFFVNTINVSSLSKELSSHYHLSIVKSNLIRAKVFTNESVNDQNVDVLNYAKNVKI